jgi:hypothetical protein
VFSGQGCGGQQTFFFLIAGKNKIERAIFVFSKKYFQKRNFYFFKKER